MFHVLKAAFSKGFSDPAEAGGSSFLSNAKQIENMPEFSAWKTDE